MKALEAVQESRVRSRAIATVKIVKLTQSGATWYFSDRAARYPYGGGPVVQAIACLRGSEPVQWSMADLPSPDPRYAGALIATTRVSLANAPHLGGLYLAEVLEAYPLEGADLEIIEIAIRPSADRDARFDLSAYAGTEHTTWFRGRVVRVEATDGETIQLRAESRLPVVRWLYATDPATVDPKDLGQRLPLPVGRAKSVRAVGYVVGVATTLVSPLPASAPIGTLVELTDVTGLPSSGSLRIDAEEITYSSLDAGSRTVTLTARGASGTATVDHAPGGYAVELIPEAVYVLSQRPLSAVNDVYLRNPYNGEKIRIPDALSGVTLADAALIPGETVATLRIGTGAMRSILTDAYRSARVTQQPEFAQEGALDFATGSPNSVTDPGFLNLSPQVGTFYKSFNNDADSPRWTRVASDTYQLNVTRSISWSGTFPNVQALNVELLCDVVYDTTGPNSGTYQINIHPRTFPGLSESHFSLGIPRNAAGSFPWSSGVRGVSFNPTTWNGHFMYVRPYVAGAIATAANRFVGLSNVRLRFGFVDSDAIYRTVDVSIDAASSGFGLEWYADVEGELVPVPYVAGHAFDSVSSVSVSGCTVTADTTTKTEGTASWKLAATETLIESFDSASGWSTAGGGIVTLDTGVKTEGTGSIELTSSAPPDSAARQLFKFGVTAFDATDKLLAVDVRIRDQAVYDYLSLYGLTATTGLFLGVTSNATFAADYQQWTFGRNHVPRAGEWFTLLFDWTSFPPFFVSGAPNFAALTGYQFGFVPNTVGVAVGIYWDRFRLLPRSMAAQLNATAGTVNLTATANAYRLSLRAGTAADLASGAVYFSNTAGSGTTAPANRRTLPIAPSDVGVGAWKDLGVTAVDVGSPAVTDVETIGVSVTLPASPTGTLIGTPTVWVDDLRRRDDTSNPYAANPGELIARRPDVIRYLIEDVAGEADACEDATFTASDTNLGGSATGFGIDLREIGDDFAAIAVRLAYQARGNLVRVETSDGSRFRLLTASAAYQYGAPVRVLTEYRKVAFEGQDGSTLRARTFAYFDFDAALGDASTAGYRGLVGATPEDSDPAKPTAANLVAAEAAYGAQPAEYLFLRAVVDDATAIDTLGFYAWCRRRPRRVVVVTGLSWRQGYDLELGDVVSVQPRWRSSALTGRVIEFVKDMRTQEVNLRFAEVPD